MCSPERGDLCLGGVAQVDHVGARGNHGSTRGNHGSTGRGFAGDSNQRAPIGQPPTGWVVRHVAEHGTMLNVPVIMFLAALAILAGVVFVAIGRGGELGTDTPTWTPTGGGFMNMAGVQVQLPPTTMIGYDVHATLDELQWLAQALSDRNAQVAALRMEVARMQRERGEPVADWAVQAEEYGVPLTDPAQQIPSAAPPGASEDAE